MHKLSPPDPPNVPTTRLAPEALTFVGGYPLRDRNYVYSPPLDAIVDPHPSNAGWTAYRLYLKLQDGIDDATGEVAPFDVGEVAEVLRCNRGAIIGAILRLERLGFFEPAVTGNCLAGTLPHIPLCVWEDIAARHRGEASHIVEVPV